MELYREISQQEGVAVNPKINERDPPHDNQNFFKGYHDRIEFIK